MTNPRCPTCKGTGYANKPVSTLIRDGARFDPPVMVICTDVYPAGERKGQPCTPRTQFRNDGQVRTRNMMHEDRFSGGMRLASEKRAETMRNKQAASTTEGFKPSRGRASR